VRGVDDISAVIFCGRRGAVGEGGRTLCLWDDVLGGYFISAAFVARPLLRKLGEKYHRKDGYPNMLAFVFCSAGRCMDTEH